MANDIYDYLDLIEEDVRRINAILIDTGAGIDVSQENLDRIFTILEDIESYANKAQKVV